MTLHELRNLFRQKLDVPRQEADECFYYLLEATLKLPKSEVVLYPEKKISAAVEGPFTDALERLQKHEPIQYVVGSVAFAGALIEVAPGALIPRPETEELVGLLLKRFSGAKSILDVCTGSGCIAIAMAKRLPHAEVSALDLSKPALEIAKRNAVNNGVRINFYEQNIFEVGRLEGMYDLIISNPPYVLESERAYMHPKVLDYEPEMALFVPDEKPLLFYEKIGGLAFESLVRGGHLAFEINENLGLDTKNLLESIGYRGIEIIKDFRDKDRFVIASKN